MAVLGSDLCDTTCTGRVPLCSLQLTWPSMSRLLALSLFTCPSAMSARSFASSSSCWALRHRERLMFACSSWKADSIGTNGIVTTDTCGRATVTSPVLASQVQPCIASTPCVYTWYYPQHDHMGRTTTPLSSRWENWLLWLQK